MGGFGLPQAEQGAYQEPARAMFELRPLSTGEILDRTFTLYRQRFWLYVGLSAVTATVTTLSTFAQLTFGPAGRAAGANAQDTSAMARLGATTVAISFIALVLHLLAYSITQAASVSAVEANYLGRETSIGAALSSVRGKWYRYVLIALWQGWSFVWPMLVILVPALILIGLAGRAGGGAGSAVLGLLVLLLLIPGFVIGFILYLRNSLGIVTCVSEKLGVRASMKRSKFLVADYKTKAFLIYLLLLVLALVAGVAQSVFNVFMITSHGAVRAGMEISTLLVTFLTSSLVQPVGAIAFVLLYIDLRVRKEGFDVEMLLEKVTGVPPPPRAMESPFGSGPAGTESPFSSAAGRAEDSPFSSPFGGGASAPPPHRDGDSPFSSGPLPGSAVAPARVEGDSPFSSGPLPGSADTDTNG